jgi:tetratricopeptide (TPR) repeat protein
MLSRTTITIVAGLMLGTFGVAASAQSSPSAADRLQSQGADKAQVEKRLQSVQTLIEKSSGAKQVEASADAKAQEKRVRARESFAKAQEAYKAGDYSGASKLLTEASGQMFEAVRLAEPEKVREAKAKAEYERRLESVKALLAAQKRIATEKKSGKDANDTSRKIETHMQEAEKLAAAGKYPEAKTALDNAYLAARSAIGSMRGGDTLVRTLNFANKEEEYHYEIDRNDTHQMLIKVLMGDKAATPDEMTKRFMDKALDLRQQAEKVAGKGDHAGAVKLLEDSTAELVRAIRSAGIYIPG